MPDADHGSGFGCLFHSKFARICGEFQLQAGFSPEIALRSWRGCNASLWSARQQNGSVGLCPQSQASVAVGAAKLVLKVDWIDLEAMTQPNLMQLASPQLGQPTILLALWMQRAWLQLRVVSRHVRLRSLPVEALTCGNSLWF